MVEASSNIEESNKTLNVRNKKKVIWYFFMIAKWIIFQSFFDKLEVLYSSLLVPFLWSFFYIAQCTFMLRPVK